MLQKELAKRLKARYDTKMDGNGWLEVSSDGIPLCRIKYNGQFLSNADQNLSDEYRSKIADIQDEISTVREYVGLYEHAPQMKAADVSDYRQLAAFGDTVLAATYSEKNGFMFCTWKQNTDGDSVFWGDYSPNYEYVKLGGSILIWYSFRIQAVTQQTFRRGTAGKHKHEKNSYNYNSAPVRRADAVRLRGGRDEPPRTGAGAYVYAARRALRHISGGRVEAIHMLVGL